MGNTNRVFKTYIAEALFNGVLPCAFRGSLVEVEALTEALHYTREFHNTLASTEDLEKIHDALKMKRASAAKFKRIFAMEWPA
jgi:histidinol dehydrogenase